MPISGRPAYLRHSNIISSRQVSQFEQTLPSSRLSSKGTVSMITYGPTPAFFHFQ